MTTLKLLAGQDHLEKIAQTRDPIRALAEFVWNALDADATSVAIEFRRNALGGIEGILIRDNGLGISPSRAHEGFGHLGDSWKKSVSRTERLNRALHGKEGRGRFRFFSLAEKANWVSIYRDDQSGDLKRLTVEIDAKELEKCEIENESTKSNLNSTGTVVELYGLKQSFDFLASEGSAIKLGVIFAAYMLQYPDVEISYDGTAIDPRKNITRSDDLTCQSLVIPNGVVDDLSLKVIEWKHSIEGRKIYFGGQQGVVLASQAANVTAPDFEFAAYAYSKYFEQLAEGNLLEFDDLADAGFIVVIGYIREKLTDYFRSRQAQRAGGIIEELIETGVYPYKEAPKTDIERRERQVFDIATFAVSSYSRDFKRAEPSLQRMTLTLLREAVRHNPDSLTTILNAVVSLPKLQQNELSDLLNKTDLGNIISSANLIAERVVTIGVLSEMIGNPRHKAVVKERGELDEIVRNNTWIFGERFHLTVHESGLTKIMRRVAEDLGAKRGKQSVRKASGKIGRADVFLGRRVPHVDQNHHEYLLFELKRPAIEVGRKEVAQLEDYVTAIQGQPEYNHTSTYWNFFLVTGDYKHEIKGRITQINRPIGLLQEGANCKIWVKTWAELIRDAESRMHFIQEELKIQVSDQEIEDRISKLKAAILREQPSKKDAGEQSEV